jgi:Bacterial regulatory proteins, luxR family
VRTGSGIGNASGTAIDFDPAPASGFKLIVQGKTNKQAARELGGSARTIEAHRQAIMEKMKAQSITQLAAIAER